MSDNIVPGLTAILGLITAILNLAPLVRSRVTSGSIRPGFMAFLLVFVASTVAFIWGAAVEGGRVLDGKPLMMPWFNAEKVKLREEMNQQLKFMQDIKNSSDMELAIWDLAMSRSQGYSPLKEVSYGRILKTLEKIEDKSTDKSIVGVADKLSLRWQYRFYYYVANLKVALASTAYAEQSQLADEAIVASEKLIMFTKDNREKFDQKWLQRIFIEDRNLQILQSAKCLKAVAIAKANPIKSESMIADITDTLNGNKNGSRISERYRKTLQIDKQHPIIGMCI